MKPLRVTYLITDSGVGGTEKMLAALILGLDQGRFEPALLALKPLGETAQALAAKGVPVKSLGLPARINLTYLLKLPWAFWKLCRELKVRRPEILHCFLFQANLLGRAAARLTGLPINISSLRVIEAEHRFQIPLDRITSAWVTCSTAVGETVKSFAVDEIGLDPEKVVVIPNGIDLLPFTGKNSERIRQEFNIPAQAPLIGTIGRLHPQKGVDLFLRAIGELKPEFPSLRALIVGEGPARPALEALAADLDLSQNVIFTGLRSDVPELLAALDLFVLSSRWEGMPNVILEAMAAGRAVVASAVGAVGEMVRDGETGILVPAGNSPALAQAIRRLLRDPAERGRMADQGRDRAEKEFSLEGMIRRTQELYLNVWNLRRTL